MSALLDYPMATDPTGSVTAWLARLRAGDRAALAPLVERYFQPLAEVADRRVRTGVVGGEDLANSAFWSLWRAVERGGFPDLDDRHDLWKSLLFVLNQKVADHLRSSRRLKRGGGFVRVDVELDAVPAFDGDPALLAAVDEEYGRLLDVLGSDDLRAIALAKLHGDLHTEIAGRLGCVTRTVVNKVRLIRAIWEREAQR